MTAAGGLTNPHVLGLNAFNPLALDIQNGKPVTLAQIAGVAKYSPALANLLVAEEKLDPGAEDLARRVEALVDRLPDRHGDLRGARVHHAGPLEPAAPPAATSTNADRIVTEELAKLALEEPATV